MCVCVWGGGGGGGRGGCMCVTNIIIGAHTMVPRPRHREGWRAGGEGGVREREREQT